MKILRYAVYFLIFTVGVVLPQTEPINVEALKTRLSSEKESLKTNKDRHDQLKKELDALKEKIKVQEDNIKLVEKRIKNEAKLGDMKK